MLGNIYIDLMEGEKCESTIVFLHHRDELEDKICSYV